MSEIETFASRIRAYYPEGLTGLFAIGGTRTTYILEHNRDSANPGKIDDFQHYSDYLLDRYFDLIRMFVELGGQNIAITALGYQSFYDRGEQYAHFISQSTLALAGDKAVAQYEAIGLDPYFLGIEPLLLLPPDNPAHALGRQLADFQQRWPYQPGRPRVIWEIASIPLYTFWRAGETMGDAASSELAAAIEQAEDLNAVHDLLYRYYARAAYGVDLPQPHFYLGTNRNGDLKMRSVLPNAFIGGSACRLFYTPYPTLMMPREAMRALFDDLAFGEQKLRSKQMDYRDKYTPELAAAEYERFRQLSADPSSILGLSRAVHADPDEG
ncbi:MAG: hypothetical protein IT320_27830 [Anaerolineae bacterium]|nr:hypothetical protein [Anaerolineae bacterium]